MLWHSRVDAQVRCHVSGWSAAEDTTMKTFGVWLWEGWDQGADAQMLRKAAIELGPAWPIASTEQTAYEASLANAKQDPERTELVQALGRVWPTYRTVSGTE